MNKTLRHSEQQVHITIRGKSQRFHRPGSKLDPLACIENTPTRIKPPLSKKQKTALFLSFQFSLKFQDPVSFISINNDI